MSSSFTTYANLEMPEDYAVGWGTAFRASFASIDLGIRGSYFQAVYGETVAAYDLVAWDTVANKVVKAHVATTPKPAIGIAPVAVTSGQSGAVFTKGWLENDAWAWTIGDALYLGTTAGALVDDDVPTDFITTHTDGTELVFQQVGIATSTTRVFFDFSRNIRPSPYTVVGRAMYADADAVLGWRNVAGSRYALTYRLATATNPKVVFAFDLPPWFSSIPSLSGSWGFRTYMIGATSVPSVDITRIAAGTGNSDPSLSPLMATSWASVDASMAAIAASSAVPTAGQPLYVEVTMNGSAGVNLDLEAVARLRFLPKPCSF